jgi:hypothetical protein
MASRLFDKVIEQDVPLTGWGMLMAGVSALYNGETEESLGYFERVADGNEAYPPSLYFRSLAYLKLSEPDCARPLLEVLNANGTYRSEEVSEILGEIEKQDKRKKREDS